RTTNRLCAATVLSKSNERDADTALRCLFTIKTACAITSTLIDCGQPVQNKTTRNVARTD
ncbi:MAG: hypothetical protein ACPG09_07905, partial [Paracoccaceae bacterium]